jgi:hypothetical protein
MLCPDCHGKGVSGGGSRPCAECGGFGLVHCCEGLQAGPDAGVPPPGGGAHCSTLSNSTSKTSVAFGGMAGGLPRAP